MLPCALIDLHCDTLTAAPAGTDTLENPASALSLSAIPHDILWAQFFAIFIPDELRGQAAISYFESYRTSFMRQMEKYANHVSPCLGLSDIRRAWEVGKTAAILTVENGSVLAGDLGRVEVLREAGVRALTLTWNGQNELGSGHDTTCGLTPFGKEAVHALEDNGILVDASHLNDPGFYGLLDVARKPFLATHSNARSICSHKRNLTDDMIREMISRNCLIGLNYYVNFLCDSGQVDTLEPLFRHAAYFLDLGAEDNLALGSDFDGADLPVCLNTPTKVAQAYDYFLCHGMSRGEADKIFFQNAQRFFAENLP